MSPAVCCALAFALGLLSAQTLPPGPQVVTFTSDIDGSEQPYALYVPKALDPAKKYPLVVSLHAEGSTHRFSLQQIFGKENLEGRRYPESNRYFPPFPDVNMVVAAPLARGSMGFQGIAEKDVYDVVNDVKKRLPIDEDRIYLAGTSMGGGGALWLALNQPDMWAAVVPVCPQPPAGAEALVVNALNLPVRIFQGESDKIVPPENSRRWQRELAAAGSPVEYTEYPRVAHPAWTFAYKNAAIFDWFAKFHRSRFPERVVFVSGRYRYSKAYWVRFDRLDAGALARIDAKFTGPNRVAITTANLQGFTLALAGHPLYSKGKPLAVSVNGQTINAGSSSAPSFTKTSRGWKIGLAAIPADQKRAGSEGPIAEAFSSRQIYVYGTGGSPTLEDLTARRNQALQAAAWSTQRDPLQISFRVLSDKEVRDAANSNLILFGNRETNEWIARLAPRLPVALNPSAADYGLIYIFPAGGRYIVVNSGLPWWTGAEVVKRPGPAFGPQPYRIALSFPDYVLFKGSLENVIVEGTFTADWKVPNSDFEKMKQTGAMEIK